MTTTSTSLPRSIVFATDALEPLGDLAREAEAAGLHRVWTTEYVGRDAVARALAIALGTTRIQVATGVAYAFTRAPLAMSALAADVHRLSGGRFALGLGSGTRGVRRWFDADFEPPARRMAAYADALRAGWERQGLASPPPVYAAGLNPVMVRWVAGSCDGVLLHALALSRAHLAERVLPAIERGTELRGARPHVAMWCVTAVAEDPEHARDLARRQLAFYLSTPTYASVAEGTSWSELPGAVRAAFDDSGRTASWRELGRLIPDEVVDELALAGTAQDVARDLRRLEGELAALGIDEVVLQTAGAGATDDELVESCRGIVRAAGRSPGAPEATVGA